MKKRQEAEEADRKAGEVMKTITLLYVLAMLGGVLFVLIF